ncbi:alpha/beta hydrolase [Oxalobacteraceae bacterium]|nr:alpha/beta hydrolase [Oxalobacteraceae bacterium]
MNLQHSLGDGPRFPYLSPQQQDFHICAEAALLRQHGMRMDDGAEVMVYEAGRPDQPLLVLINPVGISCLFMARIARAFSAHYHVLTWESRGLPDYTGGGADSWPLERHARDLAAILDLRQRTPEAIISYCSGANIAVLGLASGILRARRLCMVSPSLQLPGAGRKTTYQRAVLPLWLKIAQDGMRMAALVRTLLVQSEKEYANAEDRELAAINNLPFQSNETTFRYACMHAPCLQLDSAALLARIAIPVLVAHDPVDDMVHADSAEAVAAALPNARLAWLDDGGHFAIYKSATLRAGIQAFLQEVPAADTGT